MNLSLLSRVVRCMFYGQFFMFASMVLVIRPSGTVFWSLSGGGQVNVRSKRSNFRSKLIVSHKIGIDSMPLVTASLMVVFVLRFVV